MPRLMKYSPLVAFFVFGGVALLLWQDQISHSHELICRHAESTSEQIRIRIEGMMNARLSSLELLADRWVERVPPDFSRNRFLGFAANIYTNYPGFMGINWADPDGVLRWVYPKQTNKGVVNQNIREQIAYQQSGTFQSSDKRIRFYASPSAEISQGGIGFDTLWPLHHGGKLQGYLHGVFQVRHIMDICLAQSVLTDFCVRIHEADRLIFTNEEKGHPHSRKAPVRVLREVRFPGKVWNVELIPTVAVYGAGGVRHLPLLGFSLAASVGLSFLLHFLLQRMQLYRDARDRAFHEINEREAAETALKENEIKLKILLAELAEKNEELEAFMFTVSHDLKTPVVTIEGFIGALREDFGEKLSADGQKYLDYISEAARKIALLINDLLELSRIGRLPEPKTDFPFADLVEEALTALQYQIRQNGIEIKVEKNLPVVHGEKKRLVQVLENLLSNAVKYIGKENPQPIIHVGAFERQGRPVFFVRDNGIGIEKKYFDKIFGIFQRLPDAKAAGAGTGVGLTIIKRIIENHGGTVWLESAPGKGTTFYFTLNDKEA